MYDIWYLLISWIGGESTRLSRGGLQVGQRGWGDRNILDKALRWTEKKKEKKRKSIMLVMPTTLEKRSLKKGSRGWETRGDKAGA